MLICSACQQHSAQQTWAFVTCYIYKLICCCLNPPPPRPKAHFHSHAACPDASDSKQTCRTHSTLHPFVQNRHDHKDSLQCVAADDATLPGDGILTNLHVTDLHLEGPVPQQTCIFPELRELDLDGGNLTGTIPQFLTTCFNSVNEIDLSYNQVRPHLHTSLSENGCIGALPVCLPFSSLFLLLLWPLLWLLLFLLLISFFLFSSSSCPSYSTTLCCLCS